MRVKSLWIVTETSVVDLLFLLVLGGFGYSVVV